jgi:hypothetical protein
MALSQDPAKVTARTNSHVQDGRGTATVSGVKS